MKKKNPNVWHAMDDEAVSSALGTDIHTGLSRKEAAARRRKCGQNAIWIVNRASAAHTAKGEFLDLSAILLIITAAASAVFQRGIEALVLFGLLAVSASVRTIIFIAAQRMFENAARENLPHATVIRNGKQLILPSDAVVPGDVLRFSPGDPVTADVRLISGDLTVSETGITCNRGAVNKSPLPILQEGTLCENRANILFAGSTVLGGYARGVAFATGEDTYIFAKKGHISISSGQDLSVLASISAWCRNVSLLMIGVVLLITIGGLLVGHTALTIDSLFLSALSLAVASMSEFLGVIAAIILAVSMQRLRAESGGSVVLRSAESMEKFAETQCLIVGDPHFFESGNVQLTSAFFDGAWLDAETFGSGRETASLCALSLLCRFGSLYPMQVNGGEGADTPNLILAKIFGDFEEQTRSSLCLPAVIETKYASKLYTLLASSSDGTFAYVSGDLEDVLACCSDIVADGIARAMTTEERGLLLERAYDFKKRSIRTFAVARRVAPCASLSRVSVIHTKMHFLGFFAVLDPIEPGMLSAVRACRENVIRMIVLSDGGEADRMLAVTAGVVSVDREMLHSVEEVSAYLKENLSDKKTENICVCVKGMEERTRMVRSIAKCVENTTYIGGNLCDIHLFPSVGASVAVERSFSHVPQCLMLASDASSAAPTKEKNTAGVENTVRIISECKNAFLHLRCAAEYLLAIQVFRMTLMLAAAFLGLPMHTPIQTLWWGLILDFMAVLTFSFFKPTSDEFYLERNNTNLLLDKRTMFLHALFGVLAGILVSIFSVYLIRTVSPDVAQSVCYALSVLSSAMLAVSMFLFDTGARIGKFSVNAVILIYAVLAIVTVAVSWSSVGWRSRNR